MAVAIFGSGFFASGGWGLRPQTPIVYIGYTILGWGFGAIYCLRRGGAPQAFLYLVSCALPFAGDVK